MLCASCGSKGIHIGCGRLDWSTMEWDCEDCSSLESRRNSAPRAAGPSTTTVPLAPSIVTETLAPRSAVKRPRPIELSSSSDDSSSDESEVDITSVSDPESPSNSLTSPTSTETFNIAFQLKGKHKARYF